MIILNEKEYVENILQCKQVDPSKTYVFLNLYARYLYQEYQMDKERIVGELDHFMESCYPHYRPVDWRPSLETYAKKADKYPLCQCKGIGITANEIERIEGLKDKVLERLAFTLLCLAKFKNYKNPHNNNWIHYSNGEIYSMACINTTAFEKDIKLNKLRELGLILYAKKVDSLNIQILYLEEDGKAQFCVSDFRKLGYEWRLYKGENYVRCANCGILIRKTSNRKKYCNDCGKAKKNEQNKYYYHNQSFRKIENRSGR